MTDHAGPPEGKLKHMTPFKVANDPPSPLAIPVVSHPEMSLAERAAFRFSLEGKKAIGQHASIEIPHQG